MGCALDIAIFRIFWQYKATQTAFSNTRHEIEQTLPERAFEQLSLVREVRTRGQLSGGSVKERYMPIFYMFVGPPLDTPSRYFS